MTILVGQLPKLFGFSVDAEGFLGEVAGVRAGCRRRRDRPGRAGRRRARGLLVILVLGRVAAEGACGARRRRALHRRRRAVCTSTSAASTSSASLPQGFPPLTIPRVGLADLSVLAAGALGIALVSLADTISTASAFAARTGQTVDGNREMTGIGAANLRRRIVPGVPGQHERLAHRCGGAGRCEDAGDRAGRRGGDHADPAAGPRAVARAAAADAGRGRHRRVALAGRPAGDGAAVPDPTDRVLAVDRGVARRRGCSACFPASPSPSRCRSATCSAGRGGRTRRSSGRVPGRPGLSRRAQLPRWRERLPGCVDLPVRRPAVLRQRAHLPRAGARARGRRAAPAGGSSSRPSRSPTWTRPRPTCLHDLDVAPQRGRGATWCSPS